VARRLRDVGGTLGWTLDDSLPLSLDEQARAVVEGAVLGAYSPGRWKTEEQGSRQISKIVFYGTEDDDVAKRAAIVAKWVNWARDLANSPPNELTPADLAARAAELAGPNLAVEALDPRQIDKLGMGALSAVGRASANGPRLIVLRYEPPNAQGDVVLGLVGKAITFDAGGISLKPALKMYDMKGDMAGGAAVIAGTAAAAELELPVRILTVVAAAENLVSGDSFRPGDILRAANGKTIEITNTDAEGRLVLADALLHARTLEPTHLLDLATLTGTIEVALGNVYAGLYGNDVDWIARVRSAGERSGERAWPMPTDQAYDTYLESHVADLKNTPPRKRGSSSIAARFLARFAGDGPWAHLDIAGVAAPDRVHGIFPTPGATGFGVRLIAELARDLAR
jgi:leucyl aminopeptidase